MAVTFFNSWQLWEQMTFVLASAIVAVFLIGYAKLLWQGRLLEKREVLEEEKRAKIEQLRMSGQFVAPKKGNDIPFGVRAIQSGIQVDGIWISNSTKSPAPSFLTAPSSSSGNSSHSDPSWKSFDPNSTVPQEPPRGRSQLKKSGPGTLTSLNDRGSILEEGGSSERPSRPTYKPRRSSQLRFEKHQRSDFVEETLDQLEGNTPPKIVSKSLQVRRAQGGKGKEVDSSSDAVADNERSSQTSDESDTSISNVTHLASSLQYVQPNPGYQTAVQPSRVSFQSSPASNSYFTIPLEEDEEKINPFITPRPSTSQPLTERPSTPTRGTSDFCDSSPVQNVPLLTRHSPSPTFVPGQLHMNKSVRKINSGFEVLPAGTFGAADDANYHNRIENFDYDEEAAEGGPRGRRARWSLRRTSHQ